MSFFDLFLTSSKFNDGVLKVMILIKLYSVLGINIRLMSIEMYCIYVFVIVVFFDVSARRKRAFK